MDVNHSVASRIAILTRHEDDQFTKMFIQKCYQDGTLDLSSFILLCLERGLVNNKFSLDIFYAAYKEAVKGTVLTSNTFNMAMANLSKALFAHEDNPL